MRNDRPTGFLQVDVDGLWAVRACYGKRERETFDVDPCWREGVPRLAQVFRSAGTPASFFIVGRDLRLAEKRDAASELLRQDFELGNHSFSHTIGLTRRSFGYLLKEIGSTQRALRALGADCIGFRSPGYDVDARVLRAARQCGCLYDASVLPTALGPLMRVADAWMARRWQPGKRQFGRLAYARAPRGPYFPLRHKIRKPARSFREAGILEIPVGTTPGLRLPLTAATLFNYSPMRLRVLFRELAGAGRPVLLLLHAIDGVDCRQPIVFDTRCSPLGGFNLSGPEKESRLRTIVTEFARCFRVMRADTFAREQIGGGA